MYIHVIHALNTVACGPKKIEWFCPEKWPDLRVESFSAAFDSLPGFLGAGTLKADPKCRGGETSGKAINVDGKIKFVRKHWHLEEAHPILGEVVWVRCLELRKSKKYRLEVRDDEAALELSASNCR